MRKHTLIQLSMALICLLLAAPLVAFAVQEQSLGELPTLAATEPTAAPVADTVPTARLIPVPTEPSEVILPTSEPALTSTSETDTLTDTTTLTATATTTALPNPEVRDGPGGLPYPLRLGKRNFGVVGHFYYTDRYRALTMAQDAGFRWVRQQIHWRNIEDPNADGFYWDELDNIVNDVNNQGMFLMISVVRSPVEYTADGSDGMPDDPQKLARFVEKLATHYKGKVHAIQIWNEQNLAHENGGHVVLDDAGHYVEILAASYNSIKAVDPNIIVVVGAPAPTAINDPAVAVPDTEFLRAMYRYKDGMIRDYFDVQAVHPFGSANPPDTLWPDNPSTAQGWNDHPSFYFRHIENLRRVMEEEGLGHHQVWITEFGWATQNNTPGYEYGHQISFETQGDYIVEAMQYAIDHYPWVGNMFVWNLNFTILQAEHGVDPLHEQGSFSILNADWTPRPAYLAIQQFLWNYYTTEQATLQAATDEAAAPAPTAAPAPAAGNVSVEQGRRPGR